MRLLERVRPIRTPIGRVRVPSGGAWWAPVVSGALAATASWLTLALPALAVWVATPRTTVGWGDALGVASAAWFLAHGSPVSVGASSISIVPLGLWALALAVTTRVLGRLLDRTEAAAKGTTWPGQLARRHLPGFVGGYAGFALLAWLLTLAGPARPGPVGVLVVLLVPGLAAATALVRRHLTGRAAPLAGDVLDRLPRWVARSLAPGVWGAAALLMLAAVLVLVMVVVRLSSVTSLYAALGTGLLGGLVLTLGQLAFLPDVVIWALAWVAGPGFSVADGSSVTLSGARPGLMPMIPLLGALPTEGVWSRWLLLVIVLPVAVGVAVARRACRSVAQLSSWRTKLTTSVAAVAVSAITIGILAALATGSAGLERLRQVGPNPVALTAALLGELALGAVLHVVIDQVRQRRRH